MLSYANQLLQAPELEPVLRLLAQGEDATFSVGQSARPLVLASLWAANPRPCLLVVSGEEAADRTARAVSACKSSRLRGTRSMRS
jgi:transcription-repair coupling factor (superfamily II helicase)